MKNTITAFFATAFLFLHAPVSATVKTIEADSLYLMGDNDSKIDARRVCIQEAKRKALESAGTYMASLTQVKEYRLTKDEVTSYTAGVVETEVVSEEVRGTAQRPEIFIKVRCVIDTAVMLEQIGKYRENEDLTAQLDAARRENESLKKEREALLADIQTEKDKGRAEQVRKQLNTVLSLEEANDLTMRYWRRLANRVYDPDEPISDNELSEATSNLGRIAQENPKNSRARFLLASIHQRSRDYPAAEKEIREALAYSPADPFLHLKLGALLKLDGKYNAALSELLIAEKDLGDRPALLFNMATAYQLLGNCSRAADYSRRFFERIKQPGPPVSGKWKKRVQRVLDDCDRGELEPRRRR